jgi:hypothetical protein
MRPPICDLCGARFEPEAGGMVRFADYEPLPDGMVGHPQGLEWFCPRHIARARKLSHLPSGTAITRLQRTHPLEALRRLFRR